MQSLWWVLGEPQGLRPARCALNTSKGKSPWGWFFHRQFYYLYNYLFFCSFFKIKKAFLNLLATFQCCTGAMREKLKAPGAYRTFPSNSPNPRSRRTFPSPQRHHVGITKKKKYSGCKKKRLSTSHYLFLAALSLIAFRIWKVNAVRSFLKISFFKQMSEERKKSEETFSFFTFTLVIFFF